MIRGCRYGMPDVPSPDLVAHSSSSSGSDGMIRRCRPPSSRSLPAADAGGAPHPVPPGIAGCDAPVARHQAGRDRRLHPSTTRARRSIVGLSTLPGFRPAPGRGPPPPIDFATGRDRIPGSDPDRVIH